MRHSLKTILAALMVPGLGMVAACGGGGGGGGGSTTGGGTGSFTLRAHWQQAADTSADCSGFEGSNDIPADVDAVRIWFQSAQASGEGTGACCVVVRRGTAAFDARSLVLSTLRTGPAIFNLRGYGAGPVPNDGAPAQCPTLTGGTSACDDPATLPPPVPTPLYGSDDVGVDIPVNARVDAGDICIRFLVPPTATATATITPSATPTATPPPTATATHTATPTATVTPTHTPVATATETSPPPPTETETAIPTATDTPGPTATATGSPTPTASSTESPTVTPTGTETAPPTPTETPTPETTPTVTSTPADVTIQIGSASGAPGSTTQFGVTLHTTGKNVVGTVNEVYFPADTPIHSKQDGTPDCAVNPILGKDLSSFTFRPPECTDAACTGARALVVGFEANPSGPIPDGAELYRCVVTITATAALGPRPLRCAPTPGAKPYAFYTTPDRQDLPAECIDGEIVVAP